MAKYQNSVYGEISGRTLDTVAATWKGIKYFRSYAIPANPRSAAQTEVRTRFKACIDWCKQWNDIVYKPYWSPLPKHESQFNAAVHANYHMEGDLPTGPGNWIMHAGSMRDVPSLTELKMDAGNTQDLTWNTTLEPGESADDLIVIGAMWGSTVSSLVDLNVVSAERSVGTVTFPAATNASSHYSYWFHFVVKKDRSAGSASKVVSVTA